MFDIYQGFLWLTFNPPHKLKTHQSFLLTEGIDRFQVGVTVQRVGVHAVLKGLHFLNNFLQRRVFDAHVIYGVEHRNAIWETLLHLLQTKCLEGKKRKEQAFSVSVGVLPALCFKMAAFYT